jgi:hypothetical protein
VVECRESVTTHCSILMDNRHDRRVAKTAWNRWQTMEESEVGLTEELRMQYLEGTAWLTGYDLNFQLAAWGSCSAAGSRINPLRPVSQRLER